MRRIASHRLWLGHAGVLRHPVPLLDQGIRAVVDLAANEPFPQLPRDLTYCRFPLLDGMGNDPKLLCLAAHTLAALLEADLPTIVCCSNGLSRSPAMAAAALAIVSETSAEEQLVMIASQGKHDVSPGLWNDVLHALNSPRRNSSEQR